MDLRELKKEAEQLPSIHENLAQFQRHWLKPFAKNTARNMARNTVANRTGQKQDLLKRLAPETRQELNRKLAQLQQQVDTIYHSQLINEKLGHQARMLIDLKLCSFHGDKPKAKFLVHRLLNDELLNFSQTIKDIQRFDASTQKLSEEYEEINRLLEKNLSLEEALFFQELPHLLYLHNLLKTAQQHKKIVRDLGRHMMAITKEMSLKNVPTKN